MIDLKHALLLFTLFAVLLSSCKRPDLEEEAKNIKRSFTEYRPAVRLMEIKKDTFFTEIISNGTLVARERVIVRSRSQGVLQPITIANGMKVEKGDLLFTLDNLEVVRSLESAELSYSSAKIEMLDLMTRYSMEKLEDTTRLSPSIVKSLLIQSGMQRAEMELKTAREEINRLNVRAPISGLVANLEVKPYNVVNTADELCVIINDQSFEVVFEVLENEISQLRAGQQVTVKPYAMAKEFVGRITEINPVVENGLIKVKAEVKNTTGELVEGLNVQVIIQNQLLEKLVVPKSAVVPRDGRRVVFTLMEDSTVYWNYVTVGLENVGEYIIEEGLEEGELVVTEGNINLAHESKVTVQGS